MARSKAVVPARAGGAKRPVLDAKAYKAAVRTAKRAKVKRASRGPSPLEESFNNLWTKSGPTPLGERGWSAWFIPEREHHFDEVRKWRFDFAWPQQKVAVELEGLLKWQKGRHQTADGYRKDCEKYNAAALLGWKVLRYTKEDLATEESSAKVVREVQAALLGRSAP